MPRRDSVFYLFHAHPAALYSITLIDNALLSDISQILSRLLSSSFFLVDSRRHVMTLIRWASSFEKAPPVIVHFTVKIISTVASQVLVMPSSGCDAGDCDYDDPNSTT